MCIAMALMSLGWTMKLDCLIQEAQKKSLFCPGTDSTNGILR